MNADMAVEAACGLCRIVIPLALKYDGSCHSFGRTPEYNDDLPGASKDSYHQIWAAMDIHFPTQDKKTAFAQACRAKGLDVDVKTNTVHVEFDMKKWVSTYRAERVRLT